MTPETENGTAQESRTAQESGSRNTMLLIVNGEEREAPSELNITEFLETLDLLPGMVVVERNREIVPRDQYEEVVLQEGDRLELVHFVGGG